MNPSGSLALRWRSILAGVGLLYPCFAATPQANGQAPVLTQPGDFRTISVNTGLSPLAADPMWTSFSPMPTARAGFAVGNLNGLIYTIGGAPIDQCATVDVVEAYDTSSDRWITGLSPLPFPNRWRPSGGTLDGLIYVAGGRSTEAGCPDEALAVVQAYDPTTDQWSDKPPLNVPRFQIGLAADSVNHLLYAVGGAETDFSALNTVEVFDPSANDGSGAWTKKQHLIVPRGYPAVAALDGKVYAIGGQTGLEAIDTVEEFDPNANGGRGRWKLRHSRMPNPRLHPGFTVLDGKVYIIGGQTRNKGIISTVDVYDPRNDTWETIVPMLTARRALGVAAVGDTIFAIGGEARVAAVGQQFTYQITASNHPTYYDADRLPEGLQIDHERGIIYGEPDIPVDNFVTTLTATNPSGSDSIDVNFLISDSIPFDELPQVTSGTSVTGRAGRSFEFKVLTHNTDPNQLLQATGLPYKEGEGPALTLDPATNVISGVVPALPDDSARSFGVGLNILQADVSQSFLQLTFVSDPLFPIITSDSVATLILNEFFSYTITADAPVSSFSYIGLNGQVNGELPSGLTFDPTTGTISGIFTGDGSALNRPAELFNPKVGGFPGPDTIKKEPPPRIQNMAQKEGVGTGTRPLTFVIGTHDFEVEILPTKPSNGAIYTVVSDDPVNSGVGVGLLQSAKIGDYVSYSVPVTVAGTYDVRVGFRSDAGGGIFQLAINGANHGEPEDQYAPVESYEVRDLGPITFSQPGDQDFRFSFAGQDPASTGSNLVFDFIDLVPHFEVETLPVSDQTADAKVVQDSSLSGGAGLLVRANEPGAYLTCDVEVNTPGIYDVIVKTLGTSDTGGFELLINGAPQGYPQKKIMPASAADDGVHHLGRIKFQTAGKKAFQFVINGGSGRAPAEVLLDDIQLVLSSHFEAESIAVSGSAEVRNFLDSNLSGDAGIQLRGKRAGDYVTFTVPVPVAGSYDVKYGVRKRPHNAVVQLLIDGAKHGPVHDTFAADREYEVIDLGRVTFLESGDASFQFLITGRNQNSVGYQFDLDYIELER